MTFFVLYIVTLIMFLVLDGIGLVRIVQPVFEQNIGHLMLENIRVLPALMFYAFFIAALLWFVSVPAIVEHKSLFWVAGNAALIGALANGTYELTNHALMKGWTWSMVIRDVTWSICLAAGAATAGVWMTRHLSPGF